MAFVTYSAAPVPPVSAIRAAPDTSLTRTVEGPLPAVRKAYVAVYPARVAARASAASRASGVPPGGEALTAGDTEGGVPDTVCAPSGAPPDPLHPLAAVPNTATSEVSASAAMRRGVCGTRRWCHTACRLLGKMDRGCRPTG